MQAIACSACIWVGVHRMTASTSLAGQRIGEFGRMVPGTVFGGDRGRLLGGAADDRDDLDAVDQLQAVEMLFTERAGARECDPHGTGSSTMCPTAVLLAGT